MKYYSLFLIFVLSLSQGCVPLLVAGAGGVIYSHDKAQQTLDTSVEKTYKAAKYIVKKNKITLRHDKMDALSATLKGKTIDGKNIIIHIKHIGKKETKVAVRVGPIFNKDIAQALLAQIKKRSQRLFL